jgi:RNA-directed DNA polymerase
MGLSAWLSRVFGGGQGERPRRAAPPGRLGQMDLSRRLGMPASDFQSTPVEYEGFTIPKRSGGKRTIQAPQPKLRALQRRVLRRVLGRLKVHPAAMGFQRGRSIVTHARRHVGAAVVVHMDIRDFFPSTTADRVQAYFQAIGWGGEALTLLMNWCTYDDSLPQGAPTSPLLSNLVNYPMDCRLAGLAKRLRAAYTRYADDITFSFPRDRRDLVASAIRGTKAIVENYGYILHLKKKLHIRRRHQRQQVTGLVVNDGVALPRETRRRLRAIRHHIATGRPATLNEAQLAGWAALEHMVKVQAKGEGKA